MKFTEEGFPPLLDICVILYVCPTLAIIIYEITKNVIVTVHLLRKGFGVAKDEVISVKHVHKGAADRIQITTKYYVLEGETEEQKE